MPRLEEVVRISPPRPLLEWVTEPPLSDWSWGERGEHSLLRLSERGIGVFEVFCAVIDPDGTRTLNTDDGKDRKIYTRGDIEVVMEGPVCVTVADRFEKIRKTPRKPLIPKNQENPIPMQTATKPETEEQQFAPGQSGNKNGQLDAVRQFINDTKQPGEKFTIEKIITEMHEDGHPFHADGIRRSVWALSRKGEIVKSSIGRSEYVYHLPYPVKTTKTTKTAAIQQQRGAISTRGREILYDYIKKLQPGDWFTVRQLMDDCPELTTLGSGQVAQIVVREASEAGDLVCDSAARPYAYSLPPVLPEDEPEPEADPEPEPVEEPEGDTFPLTALTALTAVHPSQNGYTPQETAMPEGELVPAINPSNILADALPANGGWADVMSFLAEDGVQVETERLRNGRVVVWARREQPGE